MASGAGGLYCKALWGLKEKLVACDHRFSRTGNGRSTEGLRLFPNHPCEIPFRKEGPYYMPFIRWFFLSQVILTLAIRPKSSYFIRNCPWRHRGVRATTSRSCPFDKWWNSETEGLDPDNLLRDANEIDCPLLGESVVLHITGAC